MPANVGTSHAIKADGATVVVPTWRLHRSAIPSCKSFVSMQWFNVIPFISKWISQWWSAEQPSLGADMGAGLRATRQGRVWTVASTPLSINVSIHLIISGDRRSHPTRLARRCLRSFNRLWRCLSLPFRKSAGRHQGAEVSADARRPTLDAGKLWLSAVVTWWWLRPQVYRSMIQTLLSANGRRHLTCARLHCATSGRRFRYRFVRPQPPGRRRPPLPRSRSPIAFALPPAP